MLRFGHMRRCSSCWGNVHSKARTTTSTPHTTYAYKRFRLSTSQQQLHRNKDSHSSINNSTNSNNKSNASLTNSLSSYSEIFKRLNPEMAYRIDELLDQERYLYSLSNQIKQKQKHYESQQEQQSNQSNSNRQSTREIMMEPGINFEHLSKPHQDANRSYNSHFYGNNPIFSSFNEMEKSLDLNKYLIKAINEMNLTMPSHIQQLSIPQILLKKNVVIGSETGSGKTLAYLLPILNQLLNDQMKSIFAKNEARKKNINNSNDDEMVEQLNNRKLSSLDIREKYGTKIDGVSSDRLKIHPFNVVAENKYPSVILLQPNQHLCNQVQAVIEEILDNYYKFYNERAKSKIEKYGKNDTKYVLIDKKDEIKASSLIGRALMSKSQDHVPDIMITTLTALMANMDKKLGEMKYYGFIAAMKTIVIDEADSLVATSTRRQLKYLLGNLKEFQEKISLNPSKYVNILPLSIRQGLNMSEIHNALYKLGKPQIIFVGATIPTKGNKTVANVVEDWLGNAVWVRTPGFHEPCLHIAQEFRYIPFGYESVALNELLSNISKQFTKWLNDKHENDEADTRRTSNNNNSNNNTLSRQDKTRLNILVFANSRKDCIQCFEQLKQAGFYQIVSLHSRLHKEEQADRLQRFTDGDTQLDISEQKKKGKSSDDIENIFSNLNIMVASDIMCRGVDFKNVDIVINYQFPTSAIHYLHRSGRTGRGNFRPKISSNGNSDVFFSGVNHKNMKKGDGIDDEYLVLSGKVISFFNECDLDLAWHIQVSLINQYKRLLSKYEMKIEQLEIDQEYWNNIPKNDEFVDSSRNRYNNGYNDDNELMNSNIGTTNVEFEDCLSGSWRDFNKSLRNLPNYTRMSMPRLHERNVDLTRIDFDEADPAIVEHFASILSTPETQSQVKRNLPSNVPQHEDEDEDKDNDEDVKNDTININDSRAVKRQKRQKDKLDKITHLLKSQSVSKKAFRVPFPGVTFVSDDQFDDANSNNHAGK